MAIRNEVRTFKSSTLEGFRQNVNEISLTQGDDALLDSRITDKEVSITASASQKIFQSDSIRFEILPEESIDVTSPTAESLRVGNLRVLQDNAGDGNFVELVQGTAAAGFKVPNFVLKVVLSGSPTIPTEFIEGATLTQAGGFSGVLLHASTTELLFKSVNATAFNTSTLVQLSGDSSKRVLATNLSSQVSPDTSFGNIIQLNTGATANDVVKIISTSLVEAINEVQDDIGEIQSLGTNNKTSIVNSINELETGIRGTSGSLVSAGLNTTANDLVSAINEHETDIGDVATINDASGFSAVSASAGIVEVQSHIGTKGSLTTSTTANLVAAINEVDANADASIKLTSGSTQTVNSNLTFTSGNTLLVPNGATIDVRQGNFLVGGGAGTEFTFDTAFLAMNADTNQRGLRFERSDHGDGPDVAFQFNQAVVASKPARAFQLVGLNDSSTTETADIVTFYNAEDLISSNTETGIDVTWDSTNQNFDFALSADPTITLGGDLTGSVTLTNLTSGTLTATIAAGSVENSMLAGSIAASKLAGSIGNSKLSNSSITVTDGSNSSAVALGGTLTVQGTSGEVEVAESSGTLTVGLPNNVTIGNNLIVTGNLTVNGTETILNTTKLEVEDTLVLLGPSSSSTEPSTGGFGIETAVFGGVHSNAAANVTGAHSLVYNFGQDRWEADGSPLLSEATVSNPNVASGGGSNFILTGSKRLHFNAGSGITIAAAENGTDIDVTITNSSLGDNAFGKIDVSGQSQIVADGTSDTLTVVGGTGITVSTNAGSDTLTISDTNTGVTASSYGSQLVVPSITVNAQGRITSASNNTAISLSALGYSGATNADNYGSFSIKANTGAAEAIGSGETITFTDSGATTVTRSGNTIDISSVNTEYTVGDGGLSQNNFTNALKAKLDGIAAGANVTSLKVTGAGNGSGHGNHTINKDDTITFSGSTGISVNQSNGTFSFSNTSPNVTTNLSTTASTTSFTIISSDGTNATISEASASAAGVMSVAHHNKLDSIDPNANDFTLPSNVLTGVSVSGNTLTLVNNGGGVVTFTDNNTTYSASSLGLGTGNNVQFNGVGAGTSPSSGEVRASGDIVAYASDDRLKDKKGNIENALEKVGQLNGFHFNWNNKTAEWGPSYDSNRNMVGVSAQEVEKVLPEAVLDAPADSEYKTVQYEKLVPLLIESIKELKSEIEELKSINKGIE
tara:strand:+ start:29788 stop:33378 length:3591 start_codon:yes stop_codon:yes gene_type:complete